MYRVTILDDNKNIKYTLDFKNIDDAYKFRDSHLERDPECMFPDNAEDGIIDLTKDVEYLTNIAVDKRKAEYPPVEEVIHAFLDGGLGKINKKRKEVKKKYPLPKSKRVDKVNLIWNKFRSRRDKMLKNTDYTQLADAPLTSEEKKLYREYRQYLRDVPTQFNNQSVWSAKIMSFKEWFEKRK